MLFKDAFVCPACNRATPFEAECRPRQVTGIDIRCKCGERYWLMVNDRLRVIDARRIVAST